MNQANQKVVVQTANMTLISIRSAEISYFNTFFSSFGTQSALIIGFICGSISQVPGIDNPSNCNYFWIVLYWVTSAITVAASVHVLVCTIFISVFGQGLALRGPLGSMVRAVEGMVIEQQQVLFSFIISIVAFALQAIGMYWIMMDSVSAIASTVITVLGMYGWYYYSLRIFNRFNWTQLKADYYNEEDSEAEFNEMDPNAKFTRSTPNTTGRPAVDADTLKTGLIPGEKKASGLNRFIPGGGGGGKTGKTQKDSTVAGSVADGMHGNNDETASVYALNGPNANMPEGHGGGGGERAFGGFITIKSDRTFTTDPWKRHFLVVRGTLLFYYSDKRSYEMYPQKPINRRPIDLDGYTLMAGNVEPPYAISLLPLDPDDIRKSWKFRCDTLAEFNNWIEVFSLALKQCQSADSNSDLVVVKGGQSVYGGTQRGGANE